MTYKFKLYKKNSEAYIGETVGSGPKTAAHRILSFPLAGKGISLQLEQIEVTTIDEMTFQIVVLSEDYVIKKTLQENS